MTTHRAQASWFQQGTGLIDAALEAVHNRLRRDCTAFQSSRKSALTQRRLSGGDIIGPDDRSWPPAACR